jgi:hypothetical protein
MADIQRKWWCGFACRSCGAPLALKAVDSPERAGASSVGWRVTCPSCGISSYYSPGTPMMKITTAT